MKILVQEKEKRLLEALEAFATALPIRKDHYRRQVLSRADQLARSAEGIRILYRLTPEIVQAGLLADTTWYSPVHLVPGLVGGTLLAGHPTNVYETISELRILAVQEGLITYDQFDADKAADFLEEVLVQNFELAFEDPHHPAWVGRQEGEMYPIHHLFELILEKVPLARIKNRLLSEVDMLLAHRPIMTTKVERILEVVKRQVPLQEEDPVDQKLQRHIHVLFPDRQKDFNQYKGQPRHELRDLCQKIGANMAQTGLVSEYQVELLQYVTEHEPDLVSVLLHLNAHGEAEYERHQSFVHILIRDFITPANKESVYGLSRVLRRNMLSAKHTWNALNRLVRAKLHPEVARRLQQSNTSGHEASPIQLLIGGIINVLGQPLGVRQGNNPTCQSARGISMWSRHAPAKLINMLLDVATRDNLIFRYEGELIESAKVIEGVMARLDPRLDRVSVVLVPHLDKVYNEMMKKATLKYPTRDPHISVNPAFYGHWIQTGFKSVYNPFTQQIEDYDQFVRIIYASFHPAWNGNNHLVYPVPMGIFITDSRAQMLGFHAISLQRIEEDEKGIWRAYFFNPNSVGKQYWGQGIVPSVTGNGEFFGESSLPVDQFVSRVYAYHYNRLQLGDRDQHIPESTVREVRQLARESWGRKYRWQA
jgi:hypothetical protein